MRKRGEVEEMKQTFRSSLKPVAYVKPDTPKPTAPLVQETHKSPPLKLINFQELKREREKDYIDFIKEVGKIYIDF